MDRHSVTLWAVLALGLAIPAAAHTVREPAHNQSIGGGAQWAYPTAGGELTGSPGLNGSWRRWFGPHLGIEGEFGWWRRNDTHDYRLPGYQTPNGPMFDPVHVVSESRLTTYSVGANLLGRIPIGRAAVVIGGGPGLFIERAGYDVVFNEDRHSGSVGSTHFGVQAIAELEFRVTDRVAAFGGLRTELRDVRYVDSGVAYPVVGLRYAF